MAEITADIVRQLREATNVSMMECKRALVEANGDIPAATRLLRERGIAVATKKASRAANQGVIASAKTEDGRTASLIEVNCETDFVARNESFRSFVAALARKACDTDANLSEQVKAEVTAKVVEIGENIIFKRNTRFVLSGKGRIDSYIHLGGKVGVLIEVGCDKDETVASVAFGELVRDLVLHVAASSPKYLKAENVPAPEVAAEREIYAKQVQDKPPQVVEKIVDGKMKKHYSDVCLLDQPFVKDPKLSITALLNAKGKEMGDRLTVKRFVRFQLGE
jgi:elongation factor Ts